MCISSRMRLALTFQHWPQTARFRNRFRASRAKTPERLPYHRPTSRRTLRKYSTRAATPVQVLSRLGVVSRLEHREGTDENCALARTYRVNGPLHLGMRT